MPKQGFLWVNKNADNLKSREYLSAVNSHVQQWRRPYSTIRHERAKKLHSTISRTYFPWQRRRTDDESTHGDIPGTYEEASRNKYKLAPLSQEGQLAPFMGNLPTSPLSSSLDPFFRLPKDISSREKSLLQLYFTTTPRVVYGTHIHAKYCPVRDTTAGEIANNTLFMQWILLAAEVYLAQAKGVMDRVSIFKRKAGIYRELSRMIADPTSRHSNTTISVLAAAPIAEARFGDVEMGRKHCAALLYLLNSQGGPPALKKLISSPGIATRIVVSFISIGAGHVIFSDYIKLLASLRCLKETLLAIQAWSRSFFLNDAILSGSVTNHNLSADVATSRYRKFSQDIERYHKAREKAFASASLLRRFVMPIFQEHNPIEQRCHLAILTILVKVLFDLRNDHDESTRFLDEMVFTVTSGQIVGEDEPPQMKALTVVYIATDCAARYESVGINTRSNVLRSWQAVEVLELVQLTSDRARLRITELLSSSLTGEYGNEANPFVSEEELTAICDEMRLTWMRKNAME